MKTLTYRVLVPDDVDPAELASRLIGQSPLGIPLPLPIRGAVELSDDDSDVPAGLVHTQAGIHWEGRHVPPIPEETTRGEGPSRVDFPVTRGTQTNRPNERG